MQARLRYFINTKKKTAEIGRELDYIFVQKLKEEGNEEVSKEEFYEYKKRISTYQTADASMIVKSAGKENVKTRKRTKTNAKRKCKIT